MNHPVWNNAWFAWKTNSSRPNVRKSNTELTGPITNTLRTWTNSVWICSRKRLRNTAIVSWSGWSLAAMQRNATESYVARSSLRLEKTPVAYP